MVSSSLLLALEVEFGGQACSPVTAHIRPDPTVCESFCIYLLATMSALYNLSVCCKDLPATLHASPSEQSIRHRVGTYETVPAHKRDTDDGEIVNVIQIFSNALLRVIWVAVVDNEVSRRSTGNLPRHLGERLYWRSLHLIST